MPSEMPPPAADAPPGARAAYAEAARRLGVVLPVFLGMRVLSVAVIAPVTAAAALAAVAVSGRPALTDQEILGFLATPAGFAAGLAVAAVFAVAAVLGTAVMTVHLAGAARGRGGIAGLAAALHQVALRLPALLTYAALLALRVLALLAPFAAVGAGAALWLLSGHDINYHLSQRTPELIGAVAIGLLLAAAAAALLLPRLADWALSLHAVLFRAARPWGAFAASRARMRGRRARLARELAVWLGVRVLLSLGVAAAFGAALALAPALLDAERVRLALTLAAGAIGLWAAADALAGAFGLGALAILLDGWWRAGAPEGAMPDPAEGTEARGRRLGVVLGLLAVAGWAAGGLLSALAAQPERDVVVIGHRGAAGDRPENTLAAIEKAVEDGADWVEIDVQETADGAVVVIHDSDLMKLAGRDLKVWDATLEDLAGIDVGGWFDPAYADQRVPTLAEALEAVRGRAKLLIELKYYGHDVALEERVAALVDAAGMSGEIAVMSLKREGVAKMRALRPDWRVGTLAAAAIGDASRLEGDFVAVNAAQVSDRLIRAVEAAGKDLYVWTVNDPLRMSALVSRGVDGIITDEPALAREALDARGDLGLPGRLMLLLASRFGVALPTEAGRDSSP